MANITLTGTLLDSLGEVDVGAVVTFTHETTTGQTLATTQSNLIVAPNGAYSITLEYGQIRIDYTTRYSERFLGSVIVNASSTATNLPELLNAAVPVTPAVILQMQGILANAQAAATASEAFADQLTTIGLVASTVNFAAGTNIRTSCYLTALDLGAGNWLQNGIIGQTPSQSPVQLNDRLLNDANGKQWFMVLNNTVEFDTFAALQLSTIGNIYQRFISRDTDNASYILQPSTYSAVTGDATLANGLIAKLQIGPRTAIDDIGSRRFAVSFEGTANLLTGTSANSGGSFVFSSQTIGYKFSTGSGIWEQTSFTQNPMLISDFTPVDGVFISDFPAGNTGFLSALSSASGNLLVINSAVTIAVNTTIPEAVAVVVTENGSFDISSGFQLNVGGPFSCGDYRILTGAGTFKFETTSTARHPLKWSTTTNGAAYNTTRQLFQSDTETGGAVHAFEDYSVLQFTSTAGPSLNAYAGFDCRTIIAGAGVYEHIAGYQARQVFTGSSSMTQRWDGFNSRPEQLGAGSIPTIRHFRAEDVAGGGPVTFQAGFFTEELNGASENHGFFIQTPSNVIRTAVGQVAGIILQGDGQVGGFGFLVQSRATKDALLLNTANAQLLFGTNNQISSRMLPTGLWLFGTSSALFAAESARLEVNGVSGITSKATGGATRSTMLSWNSATSGNNIFSTFYTEAVAVARGSIDYNRGGSVVRYNTTSDANLKNIIGDSDSQKSLSILDAARIREYSWKDDKTNKTQIGVIAQEAFESFPGSVSKGSGKPKDKKYKPWLVDKTAYTYHLIKGYQHQRDQILSLEKRLAALENKTN